MFRLYQHVFAAMRDRNPPHKVYYHTTEKETIVGWVTGTFELYAVSHYCLFIIINMIVIIVHISIVDNLVLFCKGVWSIGSEKCNY